MASDDWQEVERAYLIRLTVTRYYEPKSADYGESDGYHWVPYINPKLEGAEAVEAMGRFDKLEVDEGITDVRELLQYDPAAEEPPEYEFALVAFSKYSNGETRENVIKTLEDRRYNFDDPDQIQVERNPKDTPAHSEETSTESPATAARAMPCTERRNASTVRAMLFQEAAASVAMDRADDDGQTWSIDGPQ